MKTLPPLNVLFSSATFLIFALNPLPDGCAEPAVAAQVHTPENGSAERKAILESLHREYTTGSGSAAKFVVHHFKVHDGWAWINVVPLDKNQKPEGDEWPSLLHFDNGQWVIIDLIAIANAIDDPVGPADPSAKFVRAVQKKYPGVPSDVFPKGSK